MSELKSVWCKQCNVKVTEEPQVTWAKLGRQTLLLSKVLFGTLPLVGGALDSPHPLIYHIGARSSHQRPLLATTVVMLRLTAGSPIKPSFHPISLSLLRSPRENPGPRESSPAAARTDIWLGTLPPADPGPFVQISCCHLRKMGSIL